MIEDVWNSLDTQQRYVVEELDPDRIPDAPGVYAWWYDGVPYYVDCARRLRVRLTRIDTHVAGRSKRRSTLRSRVALLLRERHERGASLDGSLRAAVDSWLGRASVSWHVMSSYEEAQACVEDLLAERRFELHVWRPRQGEDDWLLRYIDQLGGREEAGRVYVEVPVGGPQRYGRGARTRYIDAVRIPDVEPTGICYFHTGQFEADIAGRSVEIIEVKKSLNRTVIGQLVVAKDLAQEEWPSAGALRLTALCTRGDPALEWICRKRGIDLELVAS